MRKKSICKRCGRVFTYDREGSGRNRFYCQKCRDRIKSNEYSSRYVDYIDRQLKFMEDSAEDEIFNK
jgi:tRNA(Ile2) C34 agmatinyltransferase TiaS